MDDEQNAIAQLAAAGRAMDSIYSMWFELYLATRFDDDVGQQKLKTLWAEYERLNAEYVAIRAIVEALQQPALAALGDRP